MFCPRWWWYMFGVHLVSPPHDLSPKTTECERGWLSSKGLLCWPFTLSRRGCISPLFGMSLAVEFSRLNFAACFAQNGNSNSSRRWESLKLKIAFALFVKQDHSFWINLLGRERSCRERASLLLSYSNCCVDLLYWVLFHHFSPCQTLALSESRNCCSWSNPNLLRQKTDRVQLKMRSTWMKLGPSLRHQNYNGRTWLQTSPVPSGHNCYRRTYHSADHWLLSLTTDWLCYQNCTPSVPFFPHCSISVACAHNPGIPVSISISHEPCSLVYRSRVNVCVCTTLSYWL